MQSDLKNYRILFFGTPSFALPFLHELVQHGNIIGVVTAPDQPVGRKQILTPSPIKLTALQHGISVYEPVTLKNGAFLETVQSLQPDVCIVVAYGKIIPQSYLALPPHGFINVHPSLLPKYRGPTPIQSAVLAGETETGVTLMQLDAEVDHGALIASQRYTAESQKHYLEIAQELAEMGTTLLIKTLREYLTGTITPQPQDHTQATFTKIFKREDAKIDWSQTAEHIHNQIRALNPEPGTWTVWRGKILNIRKGHPLPLCVSENKNPGILEVIGRDITVHTKDCPFVLEEIQIEGGRPTAIRDFVNGHPNFIDSRFEN